MFSVNRISKLLGERQIGGAGFAPNQVGVISVRNSTTDGLIKAFVGFVKTFSCTLASQEGLVIGIIVTGQQICRFSIGARDHQSWYTTNVSSQASSNQFLD